MRACRCVTLRVTLLHCMELYLSLREAKGCTLFNPMLYLAEKKPSLEEVKIVACNQ